MFHGATIRHTFKNLATHRHFLWDFLYCSTISSETFGESLDKTCHNDLLLGLSVWLSSVPLLPSPWARWDDSLSSSRYNTNSFSSELSFNCTKRNMVNLQLRRYTAEGRFLMAWHCPTKNPGWPLDYPMGTDAIYVKLEAWLRKLSQHNGLIVHSTQYHLPREKSIIRKSYHGLQLDRKII